MKAALSLPLVLITVLVSSGWNGAQAAEFGRWGITYTTDDNVTRAESAADKRADSILGLNYSHGQFKATGKGSGLSYGYHTRYDHYLTYPGMSHLGAAANIAYKHKLGLGYNAWWWRTSADAAYHLYNDGDRSNLGLEADIKLGKRFGERWNTQLFFQYISEDAAADVFDHSGSNFGWKLSYGINNKWLVYATGYQYSGDSTVVQSTVPTTAPDLSGSDNIFGMNAYSINVSTAISRYGVNYAISRTSSVDIAMERWAAQGIENPDYWYYKNLLKLAYIKVL